ncbi:MAG: succinate dehydrogenase assembly factor 2 [Defluviimonas sp.]|uniref:succinate dehydrogenase assembly factor 2 n=1 Tax=Albidovulum sp. TaxID=1872424 RepID=UPI001D5BA5B4|nr:succinate dehydrogenase assembly factor 2 [Paracoccaceae bacterium]MCC0064507.1 succinate dehydrogenase assembly factor 2 [Defluviimonas sp.]
MTEPREARLKRMTMRSWRRGTKEMDLILGPFAVSELGAMAPDALDLYDTLLAENDQDLYPWITGTLPPPARFAALLAEISAFARNRLAGARGGTGSA